MADKKEVKLTLDYECEHCKRKPTYAELAAEYDRRIYLDIDGVLCTARMHMANDRVGGVMSAFDPVAVNLLRRLCRETGAKIVLSSTWRLGADLGEIMTFMGVAGIQSELFYTPPRHYSTDYDKRTTLYKTDHLGKERGYEVEKHILDTTEPDSYVILDDDSDFLPYQKAKHFVQTCPMNGMSVQNYFKALRLLTGQEEVSADESFGRDDSHYSAGYAQWDPEADPDKRSPE